MTTLEEHMIPDGFKSLIIDLSCDLYNTFPEYETFFKEKCNVYYFSKHKEASCPKKLLAEYSHCCNHYRSHFFNILYENDDALLASEEALYLLSNVDFKMIWSIEDLTDQTRKTLWKYIQLILFKVVENTHDSSDFGNSEAFFEAIDDEALKLKMTETLEDIKNVFSKFEEGEEEPNNLNEESIPDINNLHDHLSGLFKGKIGRLAEEIMEETKTDWENDFGINFDEDMAEDGKEKNTKNINDIFTKLLKDPLKFVNLIKKIGNKLEEKIKSGEVKESELLQETSEMMKNLKNTPGLKNMEQLFKTFTGGNGGNKNDPMNKGMENMLSMMSGKNSAKKLNAFQTELDKNIRMSKQRERMLQRLEEKKKRDATMKEKNDAAVKVENTVISTNQYKNTFNKSKKSKKGKK